MYLLLYVLTHSLEVHVGTSLIYTPSCCKCTGWKLRSKVGCLCNIVQLAIINDKKKLDLVQSKINGGLSTSGSKAFWTGVVR